MWYISFHGGSPGLNNVHVYHDSGKPHPQSKLLPTGGANPELLELRGFEIVDKTLYVVNANREQSQILVYAANASGGYDFKRVLASKNTTNSIFHPYDIAFDAQGNCYVSSQDTNVVTGVRPTGTALPVSAYLLRKHPPPSTFLAGTIVASSLGALPDGPLPHPPDVATPQGLDVGFTDRTKTRVLSSVRGVLCHSGCLYVSDEPANAVKVYALSTGELQGQIAGTNLSAPVQLLLHPATGMLYVGSKGNDSVVRCDVSKGAPVGLVAPKTFIDGNVKHVSGMAFGPGGNFYAGERKTRKIKMFPADGSGKGEDFITGLSDDPEFILHVPKD